MPKTPHADRIYKAFRMKSHSITTPLFASSKFASILDFAEGCQKVMASINESDELKLRVKTESTKQTGQQTSEFMPSLLDFFE